MTPALVAAPIRVQRAWLPGGLADDVTFEHDGTTLIAVRPGRAGDGPALPGLAVPGLVNAHAHLELSDGLVPGGDGFLGWLGRLAARGADGEREAHGRAAAVSAHDLGTAWLSDVTNVGDTGPWLRDAGLAGVVHHELLTLDAAALPARIKQAAVCDDDATPPVRPSPHALFSTAPALIAACLRHGRLPATIHVGEAEDEARFLHDGDGPLADLLDRLGRDWRWWTAPGTSPLATLDALGVLGPRLLLVHGVRLTPEERALAADRGASLCLCPRSNLQIGGVLPDASAWREAGVRLCLGTDSLASTPDLDLLAELATIASQLADDALLPLVTSDAADAVGAAGLGRLAAGTAPGVLLLEASEPADLRSGPPRRRWLLPPGAARRDPPG